MPKIETKQLKIFVAVYEKGSFTLAANLLSTSQPAVSEQIRNLENRLGCRLFDRLGRSIKPTRKAEILYPKAQSIIDEINKVKEELSLEDKTVTGKLIVGASTIPGAYILPQLIAPFKGVYPDTSFEIRIADSGEIIDSVLHHDLLMGVVGKKNDSEKLNFSHLADDQLVLAASPKRKIASISLSTLSQHPFLMREEGSGTRKSIEKLWPKGNTEKPICKVLNIVAVLGSNTAIKEAIKANLGVSILSRVSISDELKAGILQEIKIKGVTMKRSFYAVTLKNRTLPNPYHVFLKTLLNKKSDRSSFHGG